MPCGLRFGFRKRSKKKPAKPKSPVSIHQAPSATSGKQLAGTHSVSSRISIISQGAGGSKPRSRSPVNATATPRSRPSTGGSIRTQPQSQARVNPLRPATPNGRPPPYQSRVSTGVSTPTQPTPNLLDSSAELWAEARAVLPKKDRETLKGLGSVDIDSEKLLSIVVVKRDEAEARRSFQPIIWAGRKFDINKTLDKVIKWVDRFKGIGDIIVQYDPGHAALPWAAARFLLQLIVEHQENMVAIAVAVEKLTHVMWLGSLYTEMYLCHGLKCHTKLRESLVKLYTEILKFISTVIRYLNREIGSNAKSVGSKLFDQKDFASGFHKVDQLVSEIKEVTAIAEAEVQRLEQTWNRATHDRLAHQLEGIAEDTTEIKKDIGVLRKDMEAKHKQKLLQWISDIHHEKHHREFEKGLVKDTGAWLFNRTQFLAWESAQQSSTLWVHGSPGVGKTNLASAVVSRALRSSTTKRPVIYFYCARDDEKRRDVTLIMSSLLKQLLNATAQDIPDELQKLYERRDERGPLDLQETRDLLLFLSKKCDTTTIILDAVDEIILPKERRDLLGTITDIAADSPSVVKVWVTSRDERYIRETLSESRVPMLQVLVDKQNSTEIEEYIRREVTRHIEVTKTLLKGKVDAQLKQKIIDSLSGKADGMFLWARLQIEGLVRLNRASQVEQRLLTLPDSLETTYKQIYDLIMQEPQDDPQLAKIALRWLICAVRPLTPEEWSHAVWLTYTLTNDNNNVTETLVPEYDPEKSEIDPTFLQTVCHSFVNYDSQTNIVRLVHLSIREYLETAPILTAEFKPSVAQSMAAATCLTILVNWESRCAYSHFLKYVFRNWHIHARLATQDNISQDNKILRLEKDFLKPSIAFRLWLTSESAHDSELSPQTEPLFVAAKYGLSQVCRDMLANNPDLYTSARNSHDRTPLHAAAQEGHTEVIDVLAKFSPGIVDMNAQDVDGRTPLAWAVLNGHQKVVQRLIMYDHVDCNKADAAKHGGFPPLVRASWRGSEAMVKLLLSSPKINVDCTDQGGRTAISWAARQGNGKIVHALLGANADVNIFDENMQTPLIWAVFNNHPSVVQQLVKYPKTNVNRRDILDWSPLSYASEQGWSDIVEHLLSHPDIDYISGDYDDWTPLIFAAAAGKTDVVKLLLARDGIEVNCVEYYQDGRTPLTFAARNGHEDVIDLLVKADGIDLHLVDHLGKTALMIAIENRRAGCVHKLLQAEGISVSPTDLDLDKLSETAQNGHAAVMEMFGVPGKQATLPKDLHPLTRAVREGNVDMVKKILESDDANVNWKDKGGRAALHWAARHGDEAIGSLLLAADMIDPDPKDNGHRTPLLRATQGGHIGIMKQFLAMPGVNPNAPDFCGVTPVGCAAIRGHVEAAKLFIEDGRVELDAPNLEGLTPLHRAAREGHVGVIKVLLETGKVNASFQDKNGETPLSWAAKEGHAEAVRELAGAVGVDIDVRDHNGTTPLAIAAKHGHVEVVRELIERGASLMIQDNQGRTPEDVAILNGNEEVWGLFIELHERE